MNSLVSAAFLLLFPFASSRRLPVLHAQRPMLAMECPVEATRVATSLALQIAARLVDIALGSFTLDILGRFEFSLFCRVTLVIGEFGTERRLFSKNDKR